MAKQTFSTGQVLTAAQMTSLQQTAMGGGSPVTKSASYVLVAADAGTVIQMNSASATTITVNTSLFAAGDSVQIQNIGAGVMTITAGTATVNSAGSLAVSQYDGGFLYFSSASAALWFDYTQAGTSLPLTTKGDLFGFNTANARIPIGANGTILTADSTEALGLKWAAAAGGGMTLLSTTTLSGASTTISVSSTGYIRLMIDVTGVTNDTGNGQFYVNPNNQSNLGYYVGAQNQLNTDNTTNFRGDSIYFTGDFQISRTNADNRWTLFIDYPANSYHPIQLYGFWNSPSANAEINFAGATINNAITSLVFVNNGGNFSAGTVKVYGVK